MPQKRVKGGECTHPAHVIRNEKASSRCRWVTTHVVWQTTDLEFCKLNKGRREEGMSDHSERQIWGGERVGERMRIGGPSIGAHQQSP